MDSPFWYEHIYHEFMKEVQELGFDIDEEAITFSVMSRDAHFGIKTRKIEFNDNLLEEADPFDVSTRGLSKKIGYFFHDFPHRGYSKSEIRGVTLEELYKNGKVIKADEDDSLEGIVREEFFEEQEKKLKDKFYDLVELCKKYFKRLEEEYKHQTSEEAIKKTIEANDMKFRKDGRKIQ